MRIYLAGGAIRDKLLKRPGRRDRDFAVTGADETAFLARFPDAIRVGRGGPTYIVAGEEYTLAEPGDDILADLNRRDLTINAMAVDTEDPDETILAAPQAREDLENGVLRPVSEENFFHDPVRVFRAARFAAEFRDFTVSPELMQAMFHTASKGLLEDIAAERVGNECRKACTAHAPGRFFDVLGATGCLQPWFAAWEGADEVAARAMDKAAAAHKAEVSDAGDAPDSADVQVWMAACSALSRKGRRDNRQGPDDAAGDKAEEAARRLLLPNLFIRAGRAAARWHRPARRYATLDPEAKVDLLTTLDKHKLTDRLFQLLAALTDDDFRTQARADLDAIHAVKLPKADRDQGTASGEKLRTMRVEAIRALWSQP